MYLFFKLVSLLALLVLIAACEANQIQPVDRSATNTAGSNTNTQPANTQPAANPARNASLPVTMPLVDAMFADERFTEEVRSSLGLTDEELSKVRDAARNAVLKLDGESGSDTERSTRQSTEKARKEIEAILGPQRTEAFFNIIRNRWAGDGGELTNLRPNAVPTDTRIVVNAPAYRMDLFTNGKLVKTYLVGIGYPEFPLPVGVRRAEEIIFNPTWTPPDEPWVKGKVRPGEKVEAGSKLNPLGPIKIPIGLPSLIHGGKAPNRLGTFASHGCVGLTSPMVQEFALELASMSGTDLSMEDVKNYEKQKTETKELPLAAPIPVELRYETIVVEDGKVTIYRDVYERGTNTEENLRKVLDVYGVSLESLPETERAKLVEALERMAVDAEGKSVPADGGSNNNAGNKEGRSGKVTRTIKGEKSIVVEVASLRGKGYPTAVNLKSK